MGLSPQELARAEAAQEKELQMLRLVRMKDRELRALLGGDPAVAAPWVRCAAEFGLPAAQVRLGRMLLEGQGLERDDPQALRWFVRAAERRDAEAMNMVGRCHELGWGTLIDFEIAAYWYCLSADRGHPWGQYNFANMLFDGRGIAMDHTEALGWYERAARQGHARAMNLLARCYEEGWGGPKDPDQAFHWYRRSAEGDYFRGQFNYASLLAERGFNAKATEWFAKAVAGSATDEPSRNCRSFRPNQAR
jgi:uncharacterized protein